MCNLDLRRRAESYARKHRLRIVDRLGGGTDGEVWTTNRKTAVKVFQSQKNYDMEVGCYQRLRDRGVKNIGQFTIPRLIQSDGTLLAIEMEIVTPPCLLDFGKAYLDGEPEHSNETWAEHYATQREIWEDKFNEVQSVLWTLRQLGIYYRDPKPGNIMFAPSPRSTNT